MQLKHKPYIDSSIYQHSRSLKSPSPDRLAANKITPTRSPQLIDIKRQLTPHKDKMHTSHIIRRIEESEKQRQSNIKIQYEGVHSPSSYRKEREDQETVPHTYKTEESGRKGLNSSGKYFTSGGSSNNRPNLTIEIDQHIPNFTIKPNPHSPSVSPNSQRAPDSTTSRRSNMDYIEILKQKQQTIKGLHEIIEMINRNSGRQQKQLQRTLQQKVDENNNEIRVLRIQNQKLISVIQKNAAPQNDSALITENRQLKEVIEYKEKEYQLAINTLHQQIDSLTRQKRQLEYENQKFIKLIKEKNIDRQMFQKSFGRESLSNSMYSAPSREKESRERVTLTKIKEQHNQNMKLMKDGFEQECEAIIQSFTKNVEIIIKKMQQIDKKIRKLESLKLATPPKPPQKQQQQQPKQKHPQIQSLMLDKYDIYQKQISQQKQTNTVLQTKLEKAKRQLEEAEEQISQLKSINKFDFSLSQEKMDQSGKKLRDSFVGEMEREVRGLREENGRLGLDLNRLINEVGKLKQQYDEVYCQKNHVQQQHNKLKEITDEKIFNLHQQITRLQTQLQQQPKDPQLKSSRLIVKIKEKQENYDYQFKKLKEQNQIERQEMQDKVLKLVNNYQMEVDVLKNNILGKNQELDELRKRVDELIECLGEKQKDKEKIEEIVKEKSQENLLIRDKSAQLENSLIEITWNHQKITSEMEILNSKIKAHTDQIQNLRQTKTILEEQRKQLEEDQKKSQKQLKNYEGLKSEFQILEKQNNNLNSQVEQFQGLLELQKNQISRQNQKMQQFEMVIHIKAKQEQETSRKLTELREQFAKSQKLIQQLNSSLKKSIILKQKPEQLNLQLQKTKQSIHQTYRDWRKKQDQLICQSNHIMTLYDQKVEETECLEHQNIELRELLQKYEQEKASYEEKIQLFENNVVIYEKQLKERKVLCERIVSEKSKVEREMLMAKKIRVEQIAAKEETRKQYEDVGGRIDKLLEMQKENKERIFSRADINQSFSETIINRLLVAETTD